MDVYKLKPGLQPIHRISKEQFENDTNKQWPWYQEKGTETVQYAVCPACDNPIRLVALYKRYENSPSPHGRHNPESIPGIADYDQGEYDKCPYANPGMKLEKNMLREEKNPKAYNILSLLREQFDRIIYLLQRSTGIVFSERLARDMLKSFLNMRGHLYIGTNLCNLPLMFGYMTTNQNLYGRILDKNSRIIEALRKNKNIQISDTNQVKISNGNFININFFFADHKVSRLDTDYKETVTFNVVIEKDIVFKEDITIDPMYFHSLVNLPPERSRRNQRLLDIAAEMIPASSNYKEQP